MSTYGSQLVWFTWNIDRMVEQKKEIDRALSLYHNITFWSTYRHSLDTFLFRRYRARKKSPLVVWCFVLFRCCYFECNRILIRHTSNDISSYFDTKMSRSTFNCAFCVTKTKRKRSINISFGLVIFSSMSWNRPPTRHWRKSSLEKIKFVNCYQSWRVFSSVADWNSFLHRF